MRKHKKARGGVMWVDDKGIIEEIEWGEK